MAQVKLLKCCKLTCNFVFCEKEFHKEKDEGIPGLTNMVCPKCGCGNHYVLNKEGLISNDVSIMVSVEEIRPSWRLGEKMKMMVAQAKERALQRIKSTKDK